MLSAAQVLADYVDAIHRRGKTIKVRRWSGVGPARTKVEATIKARVLGYTPDELIGAIVQGDQRIIALNDPAALVPDGMVSLASLLPLSNTDKLVIDGREVAIKAVDRNTINVGDEVIALLIQAAG